MTMMTGMTKEMMKMMTTNRSGKWKTASGKRIETLLYKEVFAAMNSIIKLYQLYFFHFALSVFRF